MHSSHGKCRQNIFPPASLWSMVHYAHADCDPECCNQLPFLPGLREKHHSVKVAQESIHGRARVKSGPRPICKRISPSKSRLRNRKFTDNSDGLPDSVQWGSLEARVVSICNACACLVMATTFTAHTASADHSFIPCLCAARGALHPCRPRVKRHAFRAPGVSQ